MARNLKSAGSRIHPTCSRYKFKVRRASSSRMELHSASITTRITAIACSAARSSKAIAFPRPRRGSAGAAANRSYMFFRITGLSNEDEPVGAQGVPLTPGRSIAVDPQHDYGTPFFIEADLPIESEKPVSPFRRLMIAQDTGSAIVGPARADIYWGSGDEAGRIAGRIRHPGRFTMLLPRELDMIAVDKHTPSPKPKSKVAEVEVSNHSGKGNMSSAKSKIDPRAASPKPKPKIAEVEVNNRNSRVMRSSAKSKIDPRAALPKPKPKFAEVEVSNHNGKGNASSTKSKSDPQVAGEKAR